MDGRIQRREVDKSMYGVLRTICSYSVQYGVHLYMNEQGGAERDRSHGATVCTNYRAYVRISSVVIGKLFAIGLHGASVSCAAYVLTYSTYIHTSLPTVLCTVGTKYICISMYVLRMYAEFRICLVLLPFCTTKYHDAQSLYAST